MVSHRQISLDYCQGRFLFFNQLISCFPELMVIWVNGNDFCTQENELKQCLGCLITIDWSLHITSQLKSVYLESHRLIGDLAR
jgi:hypothetical protein